MNWISVQDKLPDEERRVIIALGHRYVGTGSYDPDTKKWDYDDGDPLEGVTHWMPLPTPPPNV